MIEDLMNPDTKNITVDEYFTMLPILVIVGTFAYLISFFIRDKPVADIAETQIRQMHKGEVTSFFNSIYTPSQAPC